MEGAGGTWLYIILKKVHDPEKVKNLWFKGSNSFPRINNEQNV